MKDELGGSIMTRFIGIRPKCYIYETHSNKTSVRAKGVQRKAASTLTIENFEACLGDTTLKIVKDQQLFRSDLHSIYTYLSEKVALNGYDTKRFILDDGIKTLAWGHYKIDELI